MHQPWRMVLCTLPDGTAEPTRVWLPPMSGLQDDRDGPRVRSGELPAQRPGTVPAAEQAPAGG